MFYLVAPFMSRPTGHVYIEARHQYLMLRLTYMMVLWLELYLVHHVSGGSAIDWEGRVR